MKEVIYSKNNNITYVADKGTYKGVQYFIVAGGIHPCAYVMCPESFINKHRTEWGDLDCISVHGGVTWTEPVDHLKTHPEEYSGYCFGWDYGHAGDWAGYEPHDENVYMGHRKYRTEDILMECHSAIDQYLDTVRKENETIPDGDGNLTQGILKNLGFTSAFLGIPDEEENALHRIGEENGKRWRVFIDLKSPSFSYAYNQNQKRRYEGAILTLGDLQKVVDLCKIPIEV